MVKALYDSIRICKAADQRLTLEISNESFVKI